MKKLTILILLAYQICSGQEVQKIKPLINPKLNWSVEIVSSALNGYFRGRHELMALKPWTLPYDCNPANTWLLKYKNNDPAQGSKFLGSTTFSSWLTDKYHRNNLLERMSFSIAEFSTCVPIYHKKLNPKKFILNTCGRIILNLIESDVSKTITMNYYSNKYNKNHK